MSLVMGENGSFKIMQLTDIHYVEGSSDDLDSLQLIRYLIDLEKPDLIVITGDTVYGSENTLQAPLALAPLAESGIPWTFVFGNHDTENGEPAEKLFPVMASMPGCLAFHDPVSGAGMGNHFLDIQDGEGKLTCRLILMDSGSYTPLLPGKQYDHIKASQIAWYRSLIREMKDKNKDARALTFFHIPLKEYDDVWNMGKCVGEKREEICPGVFNSGLFTAMVEEGKTAGVFAGHDHINNYYGDYYGITLGYGRATGYNTYSAEGYLHGCRLFELSADKPGQIRTWEKLEDGSMICHGSGLF